MIKLLAIGVFVLVPRLGGAKCMMDEYQFQGVVRESGGNSASGSHVEISYRDNVWYEPHTVKTRADGRGYYEVSLQYYPYSGDSGEGDECNSVLKSIKVVVRYKSKSHQFPMEIVRGRTTSINFRLSE